jgi:mono/diheme cytochrome c family protein
MRDGAALILLAVAAFGALGALGGCRDRIAGGRADGTEIFSEVCARCHGPAGNPDPANVARLGVKPLTSDHVQREMSDDDIRNQIMHGSKNRQMPAFSGALSDAQIAAVIAHVRTLAPRPAQAAAPAPPASAASSGR